MEVTKRKLIPVNCPNCNKTFKNIYSMSAHKGHCLGLNSADHFNGKRNWAKGKLLKSKNEVLCANSSFSNELVKKYFIKYVLNNKEACQLCGLHEWRGNAITFELDHIDGNSTNNCENNLRLLCPNCHSQTPTWRGRNINTGRKKVTDQTLLEALQNTKSIRQALISVGLAPKGGNYQRCKKLLSG